MNSIKFRRPFYKGNIFSHFAFFEITPDHPVTIGNVQMGVKPKDDELLSSIEDKNSKCIYEGDILQGDNSVIYSVYFDNGSFMAKVEAYFIGDEKIHTDSYSLRDFEMISIKIIGNIHQSNIIANPTLYGIEHPHP